MNTPGPHSDRVAAARLAVLQALTGKLAASRTETAVASVIVTDSLGRLGAECGVLAILAEDGETLRHAGCEGAPAEARATSLSYSIAAPVPVAEAARTGQIVIVASAAERDRRYPTLAAVHGLDCGGPIIALPLRIGGRTGGVLAYGFADGAAFARHDIDFFRALAEQCALALERAALEEEMRRREVRLHLVHEAFGIGAWEWDPHKGRVFWSEQYREIYGLDATEEPSFERGVAAVFEEDRAATLACVHEALAGGMTYRTEHRVLHPRKGLRWVAASGKILLGPNGTPERMVGIVLDINDSKRAELAVRESECRFRGLMEQAPVSIQVFDPAGRTLQVNAAWAKLWRSTLEDVRDYNVLADAQLEALGVLPYIRRAFAGEAVEIPEIRYDVAATLAGRDPGRDDVRWVSAVAYPRMDDAGRLCEVILIHRDVTAERRADFALKHSEERFRLLADTIPQLAWIAQPDGQIVWYNQRWYGYTGTTPRQMAEEGWQSVQDPAAAPSVRDAWRRAVATGTSFEMIFPLRGADGVYRPFLTRSNPLRDAAGAIQCWFGTNTDISEIKRMEQALVDADRGKDEFLATLAHELRNPLAPISSALQLLDRAQTEPGVLESARALMGRQVHHLTRLVDDLLDVSRVMRGKIELRRQPALLHSLVARAIETVQPLIDARAHALEVDLGDDSVWLDCDLERMVQVVGNLLTNAAKYTPPGGRIHVAAQADRQAVLLTVRDNGIGIRADVLPHVFELFVQGGEGTVRSPSGLGVGLTLVKNIVEMHGGAVQAHSDGPGQGATLTLRLPATAAPLSERPTAIGPQPEAPLRTRVLVVDDNRDAAESLAMLLRLEGHDVDVAFDGPSALAAAVANPPALVLLDIGMPGMDGYEVARRLRESPELDRTLIAALSGWGQQRDFDRSAAAGFDEHFVKPLKLEAIEDLLRRLARAPRQPAAQTTSHAR